MHNDDFSNRPMAPTLLAYILIYSAARLNRIFDNGLYFMVSCLVIAFVLYKYGLLRYHRYVKYFPPASVKKSYLIEMVPFFILSIYLVLMEKFFIREETNSLFLYDLSVFILDLVMIIGLYRFEKRRFERDDVRTKLIQVEEKLLMEEEKKIKYYPLNKMILLIRIRFLLSVFLFMVMVIDQVILNYVALLILVIYLVWSDRFKKTWQSESGVSESKYIKGFRIIGVIVLGTYIVDRVLGKTVVFSYPLIGGVILLAILLIADLLVDFRKE